MSAFTLVIGNKNYSSWSLRPWLAMKMAGVAFEEVVIPLRQNTTAAEIARHSPGGKVPALRQGERVIWESIAILEFHCRGVPGGASQATTTRSACRRPRSLGRNARRLHGPAHAH